ncbi:protein TEX261 isoform X2 [Hydra vulgaris]|uniref:Protein TEX261 n=1 Tax=Hydra vulgaris TaxID=6087 RepID=A0ABM4BM37_HYDVU
MFLYILSWISTLLHIVFATLSLAAGLYYVAEVVEEYSVMTAKVIKYMIYTTIAINIGLLVFEEFPLYLIGLGFFTSIDHIFLLKEFPNISLLSPSFIIAGVMVFVNHYYAFQYFSTIYYQFSEVLAYFTLCQWMVPFAFFVSLSVNESTLPTTTTYETQSYNMNKLKRSGILGIFDYIAQKKYLLKDFFLQRKHIY